MIKKRALFSVGLQTHKHTHIRTETFTQDVVIVLLSSLSCCIICTQGGEIKRPAAVCASQAELLVLKSVFKVKPVRFQRGRQNMTIGPCNRQDYAVPVPQKVSWVLAGPRCSTQEH